MSRSEIQALRQQKDQFFKTSPQAPLSPAQQATFTGLNYYDYNPDLDLVVTVDLFEDGETVLIHTTTDELRNYQRYGTFTFEAEGETVTLTIYETPHGFFLPFVDANAGKETYPAGRYIDVEPAAGRQFYVDFNRAYNPFCAYSDHYSCPITPAENRLNVAIRAGEKLP